MTITDLKELLMRRAAARRGLPDTFDKPVRLGEWVIATDGHAILALKTTAKYTHTNIKVESAKEWINSPLSAEILPFKPLEQFCSGSNYGYIDGAFFDLTILCDFMVPIEANVYRFRLDYEKHMLTIGGDDWRIIIMERKSDPVADKDQPWFQMGGGDL